jgi:3-methyl-2-oxobutanoate hydroxymethyltransferase
MQATGAYGVCAIETEAVPHKVATEITKRIKIPIFGIGSSPNTDGRFQVLTDVFGLQKDLSTSFSKKYLDLWPMCMETLAIAFEEVRRENFPDSGHSFEIKEEEFLKFVDKIN